MKRSTFLRNSLAILTPTVISGNPIHVLNHHSMVDPEVLANVNNDRVLVIIQLNGGNDGLNTVLPIDQYGQYYNARTNIAIPEKKILSLNGFSKTGLHPSMTAMQRLFNDGQLDIVQAVGIWNEARLFSFKPVNRFNISMAIVFAALISVICCSILSNSTAKISS